MAIGMKVGRHDWRACWKALEARFERPVQPPFRSGTIDLEALMAYLTPGQQDMTWRGRILIGLDLRLAIAELVGCEPATLTKTTKMADLFPKSTRRDQWKALQAKLDWRLPRIGLPVWAQHIWGLALLAGFVMMFIWPLWGMALFFGGIVLSFQVEKVATAFQYPTLDATLMAMIRINLPDLEMGEGADDRLRLAFAEILHSHFIPDIDPMAEMPTIVVDDPFAQPALPQMHVLTGDSLRDTYDKVGIDGWRIVMRECFVVGPLPSKDWDLTTRKEYIFQEYGAPKEKYDEWVFKELENMAKEANGHEINLWFEDDLYCQVNLWFAMAWLHQAKPLHKIYRVFPRLRDGAARWRGFAGIDEEGMCAAMANRVEFTAADTQLALALWEAYQRQDFQRLVVLATTPSRCFRDLAAVVAAHVERFPADGSLGRPQRTLQAIMAIGGESFEVIFEEFSRREGIYGFGDLQVKSLLREMQKLEE